MTTYQSKIYRKGHDQPITVSKSIAEKISALYTDSKAPSDYPIDIGGRHIFRKGEIKSIEILPDIDRTRQEQSYDEFNKIEREGHIKYAKLPASQKAKDLGMFELMYHASVGEKASPEVLEQARVIQERFFTVHKNRTLCDPSLLKCVIPMISGKKISGWAMGGLGIVERAVARDMQLSGS